MKRSSKITLIIPTVVLGSTLIIITAPANAAAGQPYLGAGETLRAGQYITANQGDQFVMQSDGNFVYYLDGVPRWASGTSVPGSAVTLQSDGNLVVYSPGGVPLWASGTAGSGADVLDVQYTNFSNWITLGRQGRGGYQVSAQMFRQWSQYTVSGNQARGSYELDMQTDGNLVLYSHHGTTHPIWAAGTSGNPGAVFVQQRDGNFVIYSASGRPIWATSTFVGGYESLIVQEDGNVVIYSYDQAGDAHPIWASRTAGRN